MRYAEASQDRRVKELKESDIGVERVATIVESVERSVATWKSVSSEAYNPVPKAPKNTPNQTESRVSQSFAPLDSFAVGMLLSSSPLSLRSIAPLDIGSSADWRRGLVSDGGGAPEPSVVVAIGCETVILFISPS